jgi:hypothetical protein
VRRCLAALLVVVTFGACELMSEPTADQRVVGIIDMGDLLGEAFLTVIAAPDTVTAGVPFEATISTIGSGGCWDDDGADVAYETGLALVTPFDRVTTRVGGAPAACTRIFVKLPRTVRLVFGQPGVATLRVSGRKVSGGVLSTATPATVEKQIIVR